MFLRAEEQRKRTNLQVDFIDLPGERIPLADASVDTVVSTFTLCTIPGVRDAIQGLKRVLKSDGQFIFFEHGIAPDAAVRKWQKRTEPLFNLAFGGCHVTRDIPELIMRAASESSRSKKHTSQRFRSRVHAWILHRRLSGCAANGHRQHLRKGRLRKLCFRSLHVSCRVSAFCDVSWSQRNCVLSQLVEFLTI
jgi:ubiquinone/menaquinone biosynthesis C-methylase UbiE